MSTRKANSPNLPPEIILVILDKCHELLEEHVARYVSLRRDVWPHLSQSPATTAIHPRRRLDPVLTLQSTGGPLRGRIYPLYHADFAYDDCVFWHQCWSYTALRLVCRLAYKHTSWACVQEVNVLIKRFDEEYERVRLEDPELRARGVQAGLDVDARIRGLDPHPLDMPGFPEMGASRRWRLWAARPEVVPIWAKFVEAYLGLPEGTQHLPWHSGYDKAAAYCCMHFDSEKLAGAERRAIAPGREKFLPPGNRFRFVHQ